MLKFAQKAIQWAALLGSLVGTGVCVQTRSISIQALDGKSGKPIANEHVIVEYWRSGENPRESARHLDLTTDAAGKAIFDADVSKVSVVNVWIDFHVLCQNTQEYFRGFSLAEIERSGTTAPNRCGAVPEAKRPGQLVIFARKPSFWEKMHW